MAEAKDLESVGLMIGDGFDADILDELGKPIAMMYDTGKGLLVGIPKLQRLKIEADPRLAKQMILAFTHAIEKGGSQ